MPAGQQMHPTREQLTAYSRGELADAQQTEIEQHLGECDACCQALGNLPDDSLVAKLHALKDFKDLTDGSSKTASAEDAQPTLIAATADTEPPSRKAPAAVDVPRELADHPRYRIEAMLGAGGMGSIYKAEHRLMNRPVALKVINPQLMQNADAVERFRREVQAAARLSHPNIVSAYDAEQAGELHFLVMEYVDGIDLAEVVKQRGRLPIAEACDYVRQAAFGLEHARLNGMVHRDIKPQNMMLTGDGQVKLLDFGLSRFASEASDASGLTAVGTIMGTPDYMAPEQARDSRTADIRADIYSLGCTLYCLLTGQVPFPIGSTMGKVMSHIEREPQPLSDFRDDVLAALEEVLKRMMAKNRDERYQTPAEVAIALAPFADANHAETAPKVSRGKPPRRSRTALAAALAFLLCGAVIIVTTDKGRIEIRSEVDDVQVVVLQGGREIRTIDAATGSQVKWLDSGDYEVALKGNRHDIRLSQNGFKLTRWGKAIVTLTSGPPAASASVPVRRTFPPTEPTITQDGVAAEDGGWKITANEPRTVRLFEVKDPGVEDCTVQYRAHLKTENVQGKAYLEMWLRFAEGGEYFSKGFHNAVSGTTAWSDYEIPFFLKRGERPDLIKLNVTIEGTGTVWIKDVEVRGSSPKTSDDETSALPAVIDADYARPTDFSPSDQPDHLTAMFVRAPVGGGRLGPDERNALAAATEQKKQAALAAAQAWLALVDAGKYGDAWEACAEFARNADDKETLVAGYTELFESAGTLKSRTLQNREYTTQMSRAPKGECVVIRFDTQFSKQRVTETVVLMKEKDGQWRVSGYFHAPATTAPTPPAETQPDSVLIKQLAPTDQLVTTAGVTPEDGGWKIETDEPREVILLEILKPGIVNRFPNAALDLRCKGLTEETRLELRVMFPDASLSGERKLTAWHALTDSPVWMIHGLRSTMTKDQEPSRIQLVLNFKGQGTVWVRNISLRHDAAMRPPRRFTLPRPTIVTGVNLVADPSLENTAVGERYPQAWGIGNLIPKDAYRHQVVEGGRTGARGWMIEGDGQYAVVPTTRPPAHPAYRYAARAWVRIESGAAQIKLLYFDGKGQYLGETRGAASFQQGDWHQLTLIDDLVNWPEARALSLAPTLIGKGKAVFDDLELIAFDAAELPENFESEYGAPTQQPRLDFKRWVGRWESTAEYKPTAAMPDGQTVAGEAVVRTVLDDRFLLWQWTSDAGDQEYMAILAFDENAGRYHIWLFGSGGEAYERTGQWDAAAQTLTLQVKPPAPGVTGTSTDRFINDDRIESTLLIKANGKVTRDSRMTWISKAAAVSDDILLSDGPGVEPKELAVLQKLAGDWTIRSTRKPADWEPNGKTETFTEQVAWTLGGRFLIFRAYDEQKQMTSLSLMTYEPNEKAYRFWYFAKDVSGAQWRVTWDAAAREFHWQALDLPAGWTGVGVNRLIDDDTSDGQTLIKDERGRVLLDAQQEKSRIK